jgi:hypothetical protein
MPQCPYSNHSARLYGLENLNCGLNTFSSHNNCFLKGILLLAD